MIDIYSFTDKQLEDELKLAEKDLFDLKTHIYNIEFHIMLRKNIKREKIKEQISLLNNQLEKL